jgi:hypothetical protein
MDGIFFARVGQKWLENLPGDIFIKKHEKCRFFGLISTNTH